jgi:hypothetical protein
MPDVGVFPPKSGTLHSLDEAGTARFVDYVRCLAHELLLDNWTIRIVTSLPDKMGGIIPIAQVFVTNQGRYSELSVHPDLFDPEHDEHDIRQTLIHELLHLHIEHFADDMLGMLERSMTPASFEAVKERCVFAMERMVDAIADAIAPKFGMIEWREEAQITKGESTMPQEDPKARGRSEEAHDPDRPIDPVTGEKEGLGPRDEDAAADTVADAAEDAADVTEDDEDADKA